MYYSCRTSCVRRNRDKSMMRKSLALAAATTVRSVCADYVYDGGIERPDATIVVCALRFPTGPGRGATRSTLRAFSMGVLCVLRGWGCYSR